MKELLHIVKVHSFAKNKRGADVPNCLIELFSVDNNVLCSIPAVSWSNHPKYLICGVGI